MADMDLNRREVLAGTAGTIVSLTTGSIAFAEDLTGIYRQVDLQFPKSVERLQEWIRQPSVSAQNVGIKECADLTMRMLKDAGFDSVKAVPTDRHPGILATLNAGAK